MFCSYHACIQKFGPYSLAKNNNTVTVEWYAVPVKKDYRDYVPSTFGSVSAHFLVKFSSSYTQSMRNLQSHNGQNKKNKQIFAVNPMRCYI